MHAQHEYVALVGIGPFPPPVVHPGAARPSRPLPVDARAGRPAALQFVAFAVSLVLVVHYLVTGRGLAAASASVLVKMATLDAIIFTGALWEHDVFGRYLFAPMFFWKTWWAWASSRCIPPT